MVRLNRIYTRTGDDGSSGLSTGERRLKNDVRFDAIGSVDETNAAIGVARLHVDDYPDLDLMLGAIQNDLFDLGGEICIPGSAIIGEDHVARLEELAEQFNADLAPLRNFILPGGTRAASQAHLARSVCRRVERRIVQLGNTEAVSEFARKYLNRLSDLLFIFGRILNQSSGKGDVLWVQAKDR